MKPTSALKNLKKSLEDVTHLYTPHIHVMDDPVAFQIAVEEIELSTAGLTRVYVNACHRLSLRDRRSWGRYLLDAKHIWSKARDCQRDINSLKKRLEIKIMKEEERRIRYSILRQRAARHWGDDNDPLVHHSRIFSPRIEDGEGLRTSQSIVAPQTRAFGTIAKDEQPSLFEQVQGVDVLELACPRPMGRARWKAGFPGFRLTLDEVHCRLAFDLGPRCSTILEGANSEWKPDTLLLLVKHDCLPAPVKIPESPFKSIPSIRTTSACRRRVGDTS
ncbi:hypothetical protein EDD18DRAFT_1334957 [Armillaria luteobubalina]|uniref:Uncharacterized protein n=1 Tax=Armillaria luteobubalina TaxID=153913 RepID=A0AA39PT83_9AGAR|nr:hypothetical protein EDD18DRAFT_1334957 [Armillaria luteobubalina]